MSTASIAMMNPEASAASQEIRLRALPRAGAAQEVSQAFASMLSEQIEATNTSQVRADKAVDRMVETQGANLHETMIALSKAEISLKLTQKIGSKLVQAYNDITRMQI